MTDVETNLASIDTAQRASGAYHLRRYRGAARVAGSAGLVVYNGQYYLVKHIRGWPRFWKKIKHNNWIEQNQKSKGFDYVTSCVRSKHLNQSTTKSKVTDRIFKLTLIFYVSVIFKIHRIHRFSITFGKTQTRVEWGDPCGLFGGCCFLFSGVIMRQEESSVTLVSCSKVILCNRIVCN